MKRIQDCKGMRIYAALLKGKKGEQKINYKINYKNESVWCNDDIFLLETIKKIAMVQLFGQEYKQWKVGEGGWQKNDINKGDSND